MCLAARIAIYQDKPIRRGERMAFRYMYVVC